MKSGGLGSLPKGLDWINQEPEKAAVEIKKKTEQPQPLPKPDKSQMTIESKPKKIKKTLPLTNDFEPAFIKTKQPSDSSSAGLPAGYTRATFIIKKHHIDRLKAMAYVNKTSIKDLVNQAMGKFLKNKEVATILMEAVNGTSQATSLPDDN